MLWPQGRVRGGCAASPARESWEAGHCTIPGGVSIPKQSWAVQGCTVPCMHVRLERVWITCRGAGGGCAAARGNSAVTTCKRLWPQPQLSCMHANRVAVTHAWITVTHAATSVTPLPHPLLHGRGCLAAARRAPRRKRQERAVSTAQRHLSVTELMVVRACVCGVRCFPCFVLCTGAFERVWGGLRGIAVISARRSWAGIITKRVQNRRPGVRGWAGRQLTSGPRNGVFDRSDGKRQLKRAPRLSACQPPDAHRAGKRASTRDDRLSGKFDRTAESQTAASPRRRAAGSTMRPQHPFA